MSDKHLNKKTANQSAKHIIPAKKMQRKNDDRDVCQSNLEERKDDQETNVSFCFINYSHISFKVAFIINFREVTK